MFWGVHDADNIKDRAFVMPGKRPNQTDSPKTVAFFFSKVDERCSRWGSRYVYSTRSLNLSLNNSRDLGSFLSRNALALGGVLGGALGAFTISLIRVVLLFQLIQRNLDALCQVAE